MHPEQQPPAWRRELQLFFIACSFLTRLPTPPRLRFETELLNASARYFALVGVLVGTLAGGIFLLASTVFPQSLAILLSMAGSILITGAFHEDGFADCCDGFGGGWEKSQILSIMKDSRLGTYGVVGIVLLLAIKFSTLNALPPELVFSALLLAHGWSRLLASSYIVDFDYVQEDSQSKVKPLAKQLALPAWLFSLLTVMPLVIFFPWGQLLLVVLMLFLLRFLYGRYLQHRLGGYVGDCLGAAQQLAEVLIYLTLLASF